MAAVFHQLLMHDSRWRCHAFDDGMSPYQFGEVPLQEIH
jgi:hypothetical protein